jgi:RimJ/RimL family protein N-acetyltransferase
MAATEVTVWHLEQRDPSQLHRAAEPTLPATLARAEIPLPELNRFLYTAVGGDWWWVDRLDWTYEQWRRWVDRPELATWVASVRGTPAGYAELERQNGGNVEIAYFGLVPAFIGKGLGGWLLSRVIERAWAIDGTTRVWVHTCSLDGPHALANYKARGMVQFATTTHVMDISGPSPGPWPGARR